MADLREAILVRLTELGATMTGIATVARNTLDIDDIALPALIILDADEEATLPSPKNGRDPPASAPSIVTMIPELYILGEDQPDDVGTTVNALRATLLKTVLGDAELLTIVGSNGSIRYQGCATALSLGRSMQAEIHVLVAFSYPLYPADL